MISEKDKFYKKEQMNNNKGKINIKKFPNLTKFINFKIKRY